MGATVRIIIFLKISFLFIWLRQAGLLSNLSHSPSLCPSFRQRKITPLVHMYPLLPGRPALPAWGVPSAFLRLTRHLRGEAETHPPWPGPPRPRPPSWPTPQSSVCSCYKPSSAPSSLGGNRGWRRVGGQAETLLESAPFINFGIPQASVFSSLLTLSTHPGEGGYKPHTHRLQKEKPDAASRDEGGREEASSRQQPQGPHGEELTFREQTVARR